MELLLFYDDDEINENTTQTTIRNGEGVVQDLTNSSNYGEKVSYKIYSWSW